MVSYNFLATFPEGEIIVKAYGSIMPRAMKKVIDYYKVDKSKVRCYKGLKGADNTITD